MRDFAVGQKYATITFKTFKTGVHLSSYKRLFRVCDFIWDFRVASKYTVLHISKPFHAPEAATTMTDNWNQGH